MRLVPSALALGDALTSMPVPGVKLVGPLPPALQKWTTYTAVAMPGAKSPDAARALVAFLTSADASAIFAPKGFATP